MANKNAAKKNDKSSKQSKESKPTPMVRTAHSKVHATGLFATRDIPKGTRIIEYLGDRISHATAETRYADKSDEDNHTFLFTVDNRLVIDAGVGGNEARYANHSCDPNAESTVENRRVFIDAIRAIKKGQEVNYDYNITRAKEDPRNVDEIFACRCGSKICRGSMLEPRKVKKAKKKVAKKAKPTTKSNAKRASKSKAKKNVKRAA